MILTKKSNKERQKDVLLQQLSLISKQIDFVNGLEYGGSDNYDELSPLINILKTFQHKFSKIVDNSK